MSLDKSIFYGKEKRKQYFGSKQFTKSCRNHGGCPYCEGNRLNKYKLKYPKDEITNLFKKNSYL